MNQLFEQEGERVCIYMDKSRGKHFKVPAVIVCT